MSSTKTNKSFQKFLSRETILKKRLVVKEKKNSWLGDLKNKLGRMKAMKTRVINYLIEVRGKKKKANKMRSQYTLLSLNQTTIPGSPGWLSH